MTSLRDSGDHVTISYTEDGAEHSLEAKYVVSALPAPILLAAWPDLRPDVQAALAQRSNYSHLISAGIPVKDGVPAPWDDTFFTPVTDPTMPFGLLTNYGVASTGRARLQGRWLAILANGRKGAAWAELDDGSVLDQALSALESIFPGGRSVLDVRAARVERWSPIGLPPLVPGSGRTRRLLRQPVGRVHICGDFTSEPGLPGAQVSGERAASAVLEALAGDE